MGKLVGIDACCFGDTAYGVRTQFTDIYWAYWRAVKEDGSFKLVTYTLLLNKVDFDSLRRETFLDTWRVLNKDYSEVMLHVEGNLFCIAGPPLRNPIRSRLVQHRRFIASGRQGFAQAAAVSHTDRTLRNCMRLPSLHLNSSLICKAKTGSGPRSPRHPLSKRAPRYLSLKPGFRNFFLKRYEADLLRHMRRLEK